MEETAIISYLLRIKSLVEIKLGQGTLKKNRTQQGSDVAGKVPGDIKPNLKKSHNLLFPIPILPKKCLYKIDSFFPTDSLLSTSYT